MFGRLTKSTFLWLIVGLFLVDCAIKYGKPLRYMEMGGYIPADQNPLADKFDALKSEAKNTRVLLVGSSLPMCAAACADYRNGNISLPTVGYDLFTYPKAKYFESVLKDMVGKDLPVFNYSGNGCMVSDSYIVIEQAYKHGMKPKVVVLALAPRDFIDNLACATEKTSYYDFFEKLEKNRAKFNLTNFNAEETFNKTLADVWYYYKLKPDYHNLFCLGVSGALHRSTDLYSATHRDPLQTEFTQVRLAAWGPPKLADITGDEEKKKKDLKVYDTSYNPVDTKRFGREREYLFKTLAFCRQHDILPIVVNMPRTKRNQAILPEWFQQDYMKALTDASAEYGCPFYDLNADPNFTESDFRDSVHLNGDGGLKVFNVLTAKLSKDEQFLTQIEDNKQLSLK
ncbi:MAG: DUF1574 family protein [Candidatus Obscuribacterales bacterium]|nr:DUF1574 family protein [Candidatus Obscuribacterales bacterium]